MLEECSAFLPQNVEFHSQAALIRSSVLMKPHPELAETVSYIKITHL